MKGIAPIVATILMLLIVIALVGFAYTFLSGIIGTAGEQTEEQLKATISQLSKGIWVESAIDTKVIVRNLGTENIDTSEITVSPSDCSTWSLDPISAGSASICTLPASCSGSIITVVGPSNTIEKDCS